ncbi:MAG: CPBP family intramembrane metalloprotease [Rhodopirellula sp.]|nr:CPBP family intramembrane metalloprotease [Rhodopirellula sp.]
MNVQNVRWILSREIRDQLRDRRTLFVVLVLPILLYPLLGMTFFQISQFMQEQSIRVLVVGARDPVGLPPLFEDDRFALELFTDPAKIGLIEVEFASVEPRQRDEAASLLVYSQEQARSAVIAGEYDAALYFPADFADRLEAFRDAIEERARRKASDTDSAEIEVPLQIPSPDIIYNTANEKSQIAFVRLSELLRRWKERIGETNLEASGVPAEVTKPFEVEMVDVADQTGLQGAAVWSKIFPVLLLIWAMTGAFYPAVDLCAGEKERGTLETLLSSPAERSEIVVGKLLTIMLFSMITAVLNLVSIGITGWLVLSKLPGLGPPPAIALVWLTLALVPVSALFSALCLALAAFARSTKEGQYYLMPLLLVTMPLAVLPMSSGVELTLGNSLIPVSGMVLLLRAALEGNYWSALQFAPPVVVVTLACCYLAIRWAVEQFNSESVLFRESERLDVGLWIRHLMQDRQPTPTAAAAVFCGVLILVVKFFMSFAMPQPADFQQFALTTVVTQLVVIATPALLMTVIFTSSPVRTLLLSRPRGKSLMAAAALAVALHPIMTALQWAVMKLYPVSDSMQQALEGLEGVFRDAPFWQVLIVMALVPAICEELAFRGFILSGFRHLGHKWRAIVFTAIFFGLTHGILQQSLIASLTGTIIGLIAVQSGSLLPSVLFHLVHNGLALLSMQFAGPALERLPWFQRIAEVSEGGAIIYCWPVVVSAGALAAALVMWFERLPHPKSTEEEEQERIERAVLGNAGS